MILAFIVFMMVKQVNRMRRHEDDGGRPKPPVLRGIVDSLLREDRRDARCNRGFRAA